VNHSVYIRVTVIYLQRVVWYTIQKMYTDRFPRLLFDSDCIQFIITTILLYAVFTYTVIGVQYDREMRASFSQKIDDIPRTATIGICKGVAGLDIE